jgi:hypothetical protein
MARPFQDWLWGKWSGMVTLLWILAVVLVIAGIVTAIRGQLLLGIVLIIVGLLVGPGGVSVFT